jgi:hypothetical protein
MRRGGGVGVRQVARAGRIGCQTQNPAAVEGIFFFSHNLRIYAKDIGIA